MILLDYNQVALSVLTCSEFKPQLAQGDEETVKNLVRHATLSTILSYKKKYGDKFGKMVIACDSRNYWRKEVFPHYKANRKKNRDASDLNWKLIFDCLSEMRNDIQTIFPYKVMNVDRAEADDVIAVLTEWVQDNELIEQGLETESQPVLIVSSDKDFKQLHTYKGVKQWSPFLKKFISATKKEIDEYKIEHIIRGDAGDGIPSVLCADDFLVNKEEHGRAPAVTKKIIEKYSNLNNLNESELTRYCRNKTLVSFECIPKDVKESIITEYLNNNVKLDRMKIMQYLMTHKCRLLLDRIEEF